MNFFNGKENYEKKYINYNNNVFNDAFFRRGI